MKELCESFAKEICDILGIDCPGIRFDSSVFKTKTQMAALTEKGLYLSDAPKKTPDLFLSIAHELRHEWQRQTDEETYLKDYKTSDLIPPEEYNLQIAEVDANAFATIVMVEFFGLSPKWQGMSEAVVDAIQKRARDIDRFGVVKFFV